MDIFIFTLTRNFGSPEGGFYPGFGLFSTLKVKQLNQELIAQINTEEKKIKQKNLLPKNELKIVIFNEYFFKKIAPLTNEEFSDILKTITNISKNPVHCNTIFYVNFLHQEEISLFNLTDKQSEIIAKNRKNYSHNQNFANYDCFPGFHSNLTSGNIVGI